jgi:hypothetical protein
MSVGVLRPACLRHRGALLALVDRRERGPATELALEHLAACGRCEVDLTRLALTIHALRRLGAAVAAESVPDGTWLRLRAHLERSHRRARELAWHWRLNLGGLAAATLIVGVLVGPLAIHVRIGTDGGREPTGYSAAERARFAALTEARFMAASRIGTLSDTRYETPASASSWRIYPDGILPGWKEVEPTRPGGDPPEAS